MSRNKYVNFIIIIIIIIIINVIIIGTLAQMGEQKLQYAFTAIGVFFFIIIVSCYAYVVYDQYLYTKRYPYLEKLTILSTRACFIFPGFGLSYVLVFAAPFYMYNFAQIPTSFVQAYCIFCYFGYIVYYIGGPDRVVQIFSNTTRFGPFNLFSNIIKMNNDGIAWSKIWYYRVYGALWAFMFLRPYVVMLTVVFYFVPCAELPNTRLSFFYYITGVFSLIGTGFVGIAILSVFKAFHILYDYCAGINAFWKLFILKGVVGLILGEGFLEQVYYATRGYVNNDVHDDYRPLTESNKLFLQNIQDSKVYEAFSCCLLGELAVLSLLMTSIFTTRINLYEVTEGYNEELRKLAEATNFGSDLTLCGYIYKLLRVWDLFEDDNFLLSCDRSLATSNGSLELGGSNLTISILHNDEDLDAPRFSSEKK